MSVHVRILDGPLELLDQQSSSVSPGCGARIVFDGIVRPFEDGKSIEGLFYDAYRPMAEQQLERIGRDLHDEHGLIRMDIEHSVGFVPNFACSFRLVIESAHRKEGILAMDQFIDRLKQDVPIWKRSQ